MKTSQALSTLEKESFTFGLNAHNNNSNGIPTIAEIKGGWSLSNLVLNYSDLILLLMFKAEHDCELNFIHTKSKVWVRAENLPVNTIIQLRKWLRKNSKSIGHYPLD